MGGVARCTAIWACWRRWAEGGCECFLGLFGSAGRAGLRQLFGPDGLFLFLGKPKCFSINSFHFLATPCAPMCTYMSANHVYTLWGSL
jgi:hypothetical protein